MNNLTVSLDTAKRLKEAGWQQLTYFVYAESGIDNYFAIAKEWALDRGVNLNNHLPAPTLQEILEELPQSIWNGICQDDKLAVQCSAWLEMEVLSDFENETKIYLFVYKCSKEKCNNKFFSTDNHNPTEAVAQLYLKLKENNLI